jgi:hypothetical protein
VAGYGWRVPLWGNESKTKGSKDMRNKLKALGLALVAVFAMSAIASSAAQAGQFETQSGANATVTGEQITGPVTGKTVSEHEFTTRIGTVKCEFATFHGVAIPVSTELTLTANYTECFLGGTIEAHVNMHGCDYNFNAGNTIAGSPDEIEVSTEVKCPVGEKIEVIVTNGKSCTITIAPQTVAGITAKNNTAASPMDVVATVDAAGIEYKVDTPNPSQCPNAVAEGTYNDATYKGVATLKGEAVGGGAGVGLTVT